MKKVIILRGVSGSGKSTQVYNIQDQYKMGCRVCSADDYFIQDGEYKFNISKLSQAHVACFGKFLNGMRFSNELIIVDNTFTRIWEVENYIKAAHLSGYEVEIRELQITTIEQLKICVDRNRHEVSFEVMANQAKRFETMVGYRANVKVDVIPFN